MSPSTRYFVVEPDRVFIPPKGLMTAPGGKPRRFAAGDLVELPAASVTRFIRGRRAAGDIREIGETEAEAIKARLAVTPAAPPAAPATEPAPGDTVRASLLTDRATRHAPIPVEGFAPTAPPDAPAAPTAPAPTARPEE